MKTSLLTLFLSFLFICTAAAQEKNNDDSFIVSGKVINPETKKGISFAHVKLDDTYWGIICDSLGFFRLRIHSNQKLHISALGYKDQIVSIKTPTIENEVFQDVILERENFLLKEVSVYSLGTWSDFKKEFLKTKLPSDSNTFTMNFGDFTLDEYTGRALRREGAGISIGFGKIKKRVNPINPLDEIHEEILLSKYSRKIVAEITKESGDRLDLLVEYINLRSNFCHRTNEYHIVNKIKELYIDFLQENQKFEENLTFTDSIKTINNHLRP